MPVSYRIYCTDGPSTDRDASFTVQLELRDGTTGPVNVDDTIVKDLADTLATWASTYLTVPVVKTNIIADGEGRGVYP